MVITRVLNHLDVHTGLTQRPIHLQALAQRVDRIAVALNQQERRFAVTDPGKRALPPCIFRVFPRFAVEPTPVLGLRFKPFQLLLRRWIIRIARTVLVRVSRAPLQKVQVDIRIVPFVFGHFARANFKYDSITGRAILQMMRVLNARLESGTIPGPEQFLAAIGDEHHFAVENVYKLILGRMPMPLTGPCPWRQTQ